MVSRFWPECKLTDLLRVKHGFAFKGEFFTNSGDFILLTPGNFRPEGGLQLRGTREKFYAGPFPSEFLLRKGDLLLAMTDLTQEAPVLGSAAFVPDDGQFLHNQRLGKVVDMRGDLILDRFLYYHLASKSFRDQVKASATGATVRHTSPDRIGATRLTLPPLRVQQRIAEVLVAYDELADCNVRRIECLERMARALYREWFGRGILPETNRCTLRDVAIVNRAQVTPRNAPADICYIDIASVSPGYVDHVTPYAFTEAPGRARRVVRHGDVIWSCVRPNRRSYALLLHPEENTVASTGFAVLTAKTVPYAYLYFATTEDAFVDYLSSRATGAAYPAVTAEVFEDADMVIPPAPMLARFADLVTPMLEQVHVLRQQITNLRRTRACPEFCVRGSTRS